MNPEITKIIEQYLAGELSSADRAIFEERMLVNKELREEVELQKSIHAASKRAALRSEVNHVGKNYHFLKKLKWGGLGLGILLVASATTILFLKSGNSVNDFSLDEVKELTEELSENGPIDNLESEFFAWNVNDTAFLSKDGVLVSVPDNAFLLNGKPYKEPAVIQWQEALDGATIVKSGLSTTSNGELLETQGMFSFSAKTPDGKQLTINPKVGVYVQVPVDDYKEGMKLFDGEKDAEGNINWIKPRALEKIPLAVDMGDLDFYPPEYEAKLNELKARKTKKYRDSLYLSFEEENWIIANSSSKEPEHNGELLFKNKCATCHHVYKDGTGPKLKDVRAKWEAGGAKPEAIFQWVKNWQVAITMDDYAHNMQSWSPTGMSTFPDLTDEQITSIFDYADGIDADTEYEAFEMVETENAIFIPPSAVLAFWKPKFNNTILATREFEARMQEIHRTCDKSVLDVYVRNLDKPLYELDEKVVSKGYANFRAFADQRVGKLNANSSHLNGLQAFYDQAVQQLKGREKSLRDKEVKKRKNWDQKVSDERGKELSRSAQRDSQAFNEEYTLNHKNVRKQLGRVLGATIYGDSPISNIDRFVRETTLARKTNELYDPVTGKTARIQYNDFSFQVANSGEYKQLFAYLFPSELNSYHRLNGKEGTFNYPLNDEIIYDLAIVGISESGYSYFQRTSLKGGELGEIVLDRVSEEKLDASVRQLNTKRGVKALDVKQELRWLKTEQKNYVEQKRRSDERKFRNALRPKVYPCACESVMADTTDWGVDK